MAQTLMGLFFSLIFIGAGIAAQMMVREYGVEIVAALRGETPVRRLPGARFTVTLRRASGMPRPAAAA